MSAAFSALQKSQTINLKISAVTEMGLNFISRVTADKLSQLIARSINIIDKKYTSI
jgi:hypothetical protein